MIIQSLSEYYCRKSTSTNSNIAPPGWERKEISYIIVLDRKGTPVDLQCTLEGTGKTKRAKIFLVPQSVKRTVGIASNLLWDNPEYVIGVTLKKDGDKKHEAFRSELAKLGNVQDDGFIAVQKFVEKNLDEKLEMLGKLSLWETLGKEVSANITFKLVGEPGIISDSEPVQKAVNNRNAQSETPLGTCLVSGNSEPIENLHPSIKGIWGGNPTGTSIVSFNLPASCSFNKEQGENAPMGKTAVFAYTTALNTLLGKDSENHMLIGEASTVFWSTKPTTLEKNLPKFFAEPPKDDPDQGVNAVKALFQSVNTGQYTNDNNPDEPFYVLGLSPNAARISIRFWIVKSVREMETNIVRFFNDTEIVHGPKQKDRLSLFRLLVSTAVEGKSENIAPNLEGDFMRAILEGLPYPQTLMSAAIRRIRAEHDVTYPQAALVKACLNRLSYSQSTNNNMEVLTVSLDLENKNIGYRLGRLFAVLEKIQAEANPGINATIRDRFYGSASGTPVTVFPNLMRLKNHHLSKLDNDGRRIYFEQLLVEILGEVHDFPKNLSMEEQGRFAIGYYHQTQNFYLKKDDKNISE